MTRSVSASREQVWMLMQQLVDAHSRHGDMAQAIGFRLGAGRGRMLFALRGGPRSLVDLATDVGVDPPYATLTVDRLEEAGLVERGPHPDDRRRKLVALTAAGEAALATVDTIRRRPPTALTALPASDLRLLADLLQRVVDADLA